MGDGFLSDTTALNRMKASFLSCWLLVPPSRFLYITHPKKLNMPTVETSDELCSALNELDIGSEEAKEEGKEKSTTCQICGKNDFGLKNPKSGLTRHMKSDNSRSR